MTLPRLSQIDHLVLTVKNIPDTVAFYTRVLGMNVEEFHPADGSTRTALTFGRQKINLHQSGAEFTPHAQAPLPGSADLCFLSDTKLAEWQAHLAACDTPVIEGPIDRTGATGPIQSIYVRDPDGNLIEVSNTAQNAI